MEAISNSFLYNNIVMELNCIFSNLEKDIRSEIEERLHIKTRSSKITFVESVIHKFKCAFIGETKQGITNDFNMDYNSEIARTSFYEKENKISLSTYENILS